MRATHLLANVVCYPPQRSAIAWRAFVSIYSVARFVSVRDTAGSAERCGTRLN